MIIVKISGGLGNQMFQYALALNYLKNGQETKIDTSKYDYYQIHNNFELSKLFDIEIPYASLEEIADVGYKKDTRITRWLSKGPLKKKTIYLEKNDIYDENALMQRKGYLWGYWQNEMYFNDIEEKIKEIYTFPSINSKELNETVNNITKTNSVSIHIRRGDYLNHPLYQGICDIDYYKRAIALIAEKYNDLHFFVFSNDVNWAKKNLSYNNMHYIDYNKGSESYRDMQLMSLCNHNIIANSSFSWWGSWLNTNSEKNVIGPKLWTNSKYGSSNNTMPHGWLKI